MTNRGANDQSVFTTDRSIRLCLFIVIMELLQRYEKTIRSIYSMYKKKGGNLWFFDFVGSEPARVNTIEMIVSCELQTSSKVAYLNALKHHILSFDKDANDSIKMIDSYIQLKRPEVLYHEKKNRIDEKEKLRWKTWDCILDIYRGLERIVWLPCKTTNKDLYNTWQQYLCLSMYIYHPPLRLDFGEIFLHEEDVTGPSCNFLKFNLEESRYYVCMNHDKMSHLKGSYQFPLSEEVAHILKHVNEVFPGRKYLLTDKHDRQKPLCDNLKKHNHAYLLHTIKDYSTNESSRLCVDTIRSAYYTHISNQPDVSYADKESIAIKMRSSFNMMEKSYRKVCVNSQHK